jgi:hypothetical protein
LGRVVTCDHGEGAATVLSGLTITNGDAYTGAGMYNHESSPTVMNCIFRENEADWGGGVCNRDFSSPAFGNCLFIENLARSGHGGGIYNLHECQPVIADCEFISNTAELSGGAIMNDSAASAIMLRCLFLANTAAGGGAVLNAAGSSIFIMDCIFKGTTANYGGGVWNGEGCQPSIINCLFHANRALQCGGGLRNLYESNPEVINCTFVANSAVWYGGAVRNYESSPTLDNCILWGNQAMDGNEVSNYGFSHPAFRCCDISGSGGSGGGWVDALGINGGGNIDANPLFADPDNHDFHLSAGSPCIDASDNASLPVDVTTDLDGKPRFVDDPDTEDTGYGDPPVVDIGPYEFQDESCPADVNGNETVDIHDLLQILSAWGPCEDCPEDVNGDGVADIDDVFAVLAAWGPCP